MENQINCFFCEKRIISDIWVNDRRFNDHFCHCECPNCGTYDIHFQDDGKLKKYFESGTQKHLLSGCIREMNDLGVSIETITKDNIESIFSDPRVPKTLMEKLDKLLLHIYRRTEELYQEVEIDENMPAIA